MEEKKPSKTQNKKLLANIPDGLLLRIYEKAKKATRSTTEHIIHLMKLEAND